MKNNIVECRTCNGTVSKKAKTCPHCGEKKPAKKRKKFSERSKPMQLLIILGACTWALIFMAISNAPERPKKELTEAELKQGITRSYCQELVMKGLKITDGAKIPLTRSWPIAMDDQNLRFKYTDTVQAKNNFGVTLEQQFECHVTFLAGQEVPVYLKIGDQVVIEKKF